MIDSITRDATFDAPVERVWQVLTTTPGLEKWMCPVVRPFRLEPGEVIWFRWKDDQFRAQITVVEKPQLFSWEWYPGSGEDVSIPLEDQGPLTTVTFTIEAIDQGTRLTMTETGFAALGEERHRTAVTENTEGWDECMVQFGEALAALAIV